MSILRKAWITKNEGDSVSLSLQSSNVKKEHLRIKAVEKTAGEPVSLHKIEIDFLSIRDVQKIQKAIEGYLQEQVIK
jgi:hypothetical protein